MLGTVTTLRRYPVKSMLGEEVASSEVSPRGLTGDRGLALIHRTTGRVASAKNPRLWRALLTLTARAADTGPETGTAVRITLPDGRTVRSTDTDVDDVLSRFLGQDVTLTAEPPPDAAMEHADPDQVIRGGVTAQADISLVQISAGAPPGTFFNFAPVHIVTTSTLDRIAKLSPDGTAEAPRYRPNIVLSTPGHDGFTENDWLGRDLAVSNSDLLLRVVARTPRCAVPTLPQGPAPGQAGSLPRSAAALRVVADHNRVLPREHSTAPEPCAGVYAQVIRPGRIAVGDTLSLR
ncbi:MAG TPA: MOSC N-terminal beta barrel domain-containing protein [Streptosporangiaceae bacterium]